MADVNISKYRASVVRDGSKPASPGFVVSEGQDPVDPAGTGQNHLPVTIAPTATGLSITDSQILSGAGTVGQYIRGDGSLADFPSASGGGSSVSYYLNGSVNQGTIGGVAYKELSKVPVLGTGTDFTINADGYIASFLTDAGDPNLLEIPGGNWNFETYFSASSSGGTPTFYVELYKYDGTTFTLLASNSGAPEFIAFGTTLTSYFSTLAVPTTTLALTDRLAIRYYVNHSGRTITLHTENNHLCQVITTFTTGVTALNGLTAQVQYFAVGTSGTDFNIASATATHTFNLPTASATNRGALSSADWSLFTQAYNDKINSAAVTGTTTKTLTLTQQDGGTITASWSDLNTDAVLSVFGRTGAVVAANGDYTTAQVTESGNLYYTEARVNANANVAANTAARHNAVTIGTANGLSLSTQVLSLGLASAGVTGALSGSDWSTFNSKANSNGSNASGTWGINITGNAATVGTFAETAFAVNQRGGNISLNTVLDNNGLRNGMYRVDSGVTSSPNSARFWALNVYGNQNNVVSQIASDFQTGETFVRGYNSAWSAWRRVWDNVNLTSPITSVTASSPLASSGGTTPNITIQQASASQSGFLSSTDWTTFNNKQNALTNPVTGTGTTNYLPKFTGSTTIGNSALQEISGNLGLGVTPSAWNSAYKAMQFGTTGAIFGESGDAANYFTTNTFVDSVGFKYITSDWALGYFQENGVHSWRNAPSGTAGNAISFTQAMTLFSTGNLLVGSPSPISDNGARLQVSGSIRSGFANTSALLVQSNGTATTGAAIAIQQVTGEGDTIIFGDYEPFAEYGIIARNSLDSIDFTGGTTTGSLDNYNITNRSGNVRTAYVKARIGLGSGITAFGGNVGIGTTTFAYSPRLAVASVGQNSIAIQTTDTVQGSAGTILYLGTGSSTGSSTYGQIVPLGNGGTSAANLVLQPTGLNGNVLIGTTTDNGNRLRVNGNVWVDGEVAVNAITCTSGNTNTFINPIGTTGIIYSGQGTTAVHQFLVNSGERFAVTNTGIRTDAPTGGSVGIWKLGTAVNGTVNANRLIRIEIDGVGYDLVARQII